MNIAITAICECARFLQLFGKKEKEVAAMCFCLAENETTVLYTTYSAEKAVFRSDIIQISFERGSHDFFDFTQYKGPPRQRH